MIAASQPEISSLAAGWPKAGDDPDYFRLEGFGRTRQDYYGLTARFDSAAGPLSVTVARAGDTDELEHAVLREFVYDIAWVIPLIVGATSAHGIRGGTGSASSSQAYAITSLLGAGRSSATL